MVPQQFYDTIIAPYKGRLEVWYNQHKGFITDLKILLITVWVVLFPKSRIVYKSFSDLPKSTLITDKE